MGRRYKTPTAAAVICKVNGNDHERLSNKLTIGGPARFRVVMPSFENIAPILEECEHDALGGERWVRRRDPEVMIEVMAAALIEVQDG